MNFLWNKRPHARRSSRPGYIAAAAIASLARTTEVGVGNRLVVFIGEKYLAIFEERVK